MLEEKPSQSKDDADDDWGDFDQYEDPNDVQFPTLESKTSIAQSSQSEESKQDGQSKPGAAVQEFPKVTNLDDLLSLMNVGASIAP